MAKCKVTILKQFYDAELARKYLVNPENLYPCRYFPEMGKSWVIDESVKMPEGFCPSAWDVLKVDIATFAQGGGNIAGSDWMRDENKMLSCCTDAVRPAVFLMERMDD